MCPGESAGSSSGQGGPDDLASAILARIAGGDLPAGAELDPARFAQLFGVPEAAILEALQRLEGRGAVRPQGAGWRVVRGPDGEGRDLLHWAVPVLRSVVALAIARISPAEAAGVLAAYDRYAGLAGDGSVSARLVGYRLVLARLAAASGSQFHANSLLGVLDQAEPALRRMLSHQMACRRTAEPDDELGRLAQAMMQGNADAATAALDDHLILLGRYLDCRQPTGPR
jgi:DNA-binding GntR family transcriptional regulator